MTNRSFSFQIRKHLSGVLRSRRLWLGIISACFVILVLLTIAYRSAELIAPNATAIFVDRYGTYLSESEQERLGFWDVSETEYSLLTQPARDGRYRIAQALVAIEDRRFASHGGVDIRAVSRAFLNNWKGGPRQGGSTLAMQVARMQGQRHRGYAAKLHEMLEAKMLTVRFGREAVLRHYLKIAPQGNRMHGMSYGARRYFHKPLKDLSWSEASLLAALPKAPGRMNLYRMTGLKSAKSRAALVLKRLNQQGYLDDQDHASALQELASLMVPEREVRPFEAYHAILRLQNQAKAVRFQRPIQTTLDLKLQQDIDALAFETIEDLRPQGAGNIAVMVAARETGDVLAYIGSDFYDDNEYAGSIDYARTRRSSGSTLKPFIFAQGLDVGYFQPNSILDDLPLHITHEGGHYTASNYDGTYLGPMLYRKALANSRNIPALEVLRKVGVREAYQKLQHLGLGKSGVSSRDLGLGLAIGGLYVSLEELMGAYGSLANDGLRFNLRWFTESRGGPVVEERIFREDVARHLSLFLSDGAARAPSFKRLNFPFPVAIKTGTSQSYRDAWAMAYSRDHIVGVWIGHPDHTPMKGVSGQDAAFLVGKIFERLDPEASRGIDPKSFPPPRESEAVALCPLTGMAANSGCDTRAYEFFPKGREPLIPTSVHPRIALDATNGKRATDQTPASRIRLEHKTVLPARYADWASRHGYETGLVEARAQQASIKVKSPAPNARYRLDPSTPKSFQSLPLIAAVEPSVPEVLWYVNGKLFKRVRYPYSVNWPLEAGEFRIQARFPDAAVASEEVFISIR